MITPLAPQKYVSRGAAVKSIRHLRLFYSVFMQHRAMWGRRLAALICGLVGDQMALRIAGGRFRLWLEPISKSPEEDNEAGELNKVQEVLGVVLPADEDSALPLDPGEEALNEPAAHIAG